MPHMYRRKLYKDILIVTKLQTHMLRLQTMNVIYVNQPAQQRGNFSHAM